MKDGANQSKRVGEKKVYRKKGRLVEKNRQGTCVWKGGKYFRARGLWCACLCKNLLE